MGKNHHYPRIDNCPAMDVSSTQIHERIILKEV
jgi:hypothetical protein